jgi:serine phosphatase RsbU (regulator of sigma subunit)
MTKFHTPFKKVLGLNNFITLCIIFLQFTDVSGQERKNVLSERSLNQSSNRPVLIFYSKVVTDDRPCENAVVKLFIEDSFDYSADSNVAIQTINLEADGEIYVEVPKNLSLILEVSKPGYVHKRFKIDTRNIPDDVLSRFSIESISMVKPVPKVNYQFFDYPLTLIRFDYNIGNFNYDQDYLELATNAMDVMRNLEAKSEMIVINEKEKLIESFKIEQQEKRNLVIFIVVVFLLVALSFILYFVNRSNKNKSKLLKLLNEKNIEITNKNHEIIESITYAKRLQDAILPPLEFINEHLPNNFILYKPKDIVAGDFYWAESKNGMFFMASADSTGHGVPGAMVSVVCSNALNRAVKEFNLTETGKILDKTRELVLETFEKSTSEVKDGMDISLLCLSLTNKQIFWSGANNPLWYIQDNQLKEIKADKQPIGKTEYPKPFTTHQIEYKENTSFYLFTDGFADQFGGPQGKKFKYKQFSDLILKNNFRPQKQQAEVISKAFTDWKGDLEQIDDVCVIGIVL